MCPYAYQTSIWIRDVRRPDRSRDRAGASSRSRRSTSGEGAKHPWEREWSYGFSQMRVGALLRRRGQDEVDRWYAEVGRAFHDDGIKTQDREVHRVLLERLGLGADVVDEALADPTTADEVRADHDFVVREKAAWGVPTLVFPDGQALFGPVIAPAVLGRTAVRAVGPGRGLDASSPTSTRCSGPSRPTTSARSPTTFRPYLEARAHGRAWPTRRPDAGGHPDQAHRGRGSIRVRTRPRTRPCRRRGRPGWPGPWPPGCSPG